MTHWEWKPFAALTVEELYAVLALRSEVFVVEQRSIYLDADGRDAACHHLLGTARDERGPFLAAYLRVLPPGLKYEDPSIGRIVVSPRARRTGVGRELTARGIAYVEATYPGRRICISAQHYLLRFYESFGFRAEGDVYDEDGIPHIEMVR
jgi:ElaA protein